MAFKSISLKDKFPKVVNHIKRNKFILRDDIILSLVITSIGWGFNSLIKGIQFQFNYVDILYISLITSILFIVHTYNDYWETEYHIEITTKPLLENTQESDLVIYTSVIPSFQDWFKPELVKYLINSSPLFKSNKDQMAFRYFILKQDDWEHLRSNKIELLCANHLNDIHKLLQINAFAFDLGKVIDKLKYQRPLDFCIEYKFKDIGSLNLLDSENILKSLAIIPKLNSKNQLDGFEYYDLNKAKQKEKWEYYHFVSMLFYNCVVDGGRNGLDYEKFHDKLAQLNTIM